MLLSLSLIAAQRSWASFRAIFSRGISQVTTPHPPRPPAHRPTHLPSYGASLQLDVSTMRPLAQRRYPDGAPSGVGAGASLAFLRTCIDDISLLLYASLARAGARPHARNRGLLVSSCSAIGVGDEAFRTAIFLHWHDLRALAGFLQIALSAIVALASALATHRQPTKCAALSSHASASFCDLSYLLTNGEDRYLFAALKTVPSICQPTYASEFSSFLPS